MLLETKFKELSVAYLGFGFNGFSRERQKTSGHFFGFQNVSHPSCHLVNCRGRKHESQTRRKLSRNKTVMNDDVIFFFASKGPYQIYDQHCKGILATVVIGSQHAPVLNFINSSHLV